MGSKDELKIEKGATHFIPGIIQIPHGQWQIRAQEILIA